MQKIVKLGLVMFMMLLALSLCTACMGTARISPNGGFNYGSTANNPGVRDGLTGDLSNTGTRVIEGYIVGYDNNRVTIDQVEFLTTSHTARINELGLNTTRDFANGYYVVNDGTRDRITLPVASSVQVRFANAATEGPHDGLSADGLRQGTAYTTNNTTGHTGTDANRVLDGSLPNNTNNTAGNTGVLNDNTVGSGTGSVVRHIGHTMGGVAGGVVGGLEMLTNRFNTGLATSGEKIPYFITIENGYVTGIEEAHAFSNFAGTTTTNRGLTTNTTVR